MKTMKNLNIKKAAGLACLLAGLTIGTMAQSKVASKKGNKADKEEMKVVSVTESGEEVKKGEMKVIMITDENGKVDKTVETYSLDDKEKVKKMLKEKGIEMNFGEDSGYKFVVGEGSGKNIMIQTTEEDSEENDKGEVITKKVKVYEFKSDGEPGENVFINEDVEVDIEEIEGEDGVKKIVKVFAGDGGEENAFIFKSNGKMEEGKVMVFVRKETASSTSSELPTSIKEVYSDDTNLKDLNLYPNPTNGNFKMNFTSEKPSDIQLSITDAKGSKIYKKQLRNFKGEFNEDFDLSREEAGVYFFNLNSKDQSISKQIIVQ